MSLEKARNFPPYDVGWAKDRITNGAPHITRMCGSGALRHTTSGGLSPSGKVAKVLAPGQAGMLVLGRWGRWGLTREGMCLFFSEFWLYSLGGPALALA